MLPLLLNWRPTNAANGLPPAPVIAARIDWDGTGWEDNSFAGLLALPSAIPAIPAIDVVHPAELSWTRGVRADFSGDQTGSATLVLHNEDDAYTPDRNWCDNPSFETGLTGWSAKATGLTLAATSLGMIVGDAAPGAGASCAEAVLPASATAGVSYAMPWRFRAGLTYAFAIRLRSMSGSTSVACGIGSAGTPADLATAGGTITGSWATYSGTWTPSADRTDAALFIRVTGAAAATVRIDAIQLNPGSSANTYLEAPTKGQLVPGRPVHVQSAWGAGIAPHFFGYIQRITPDPVGRSVSILCHDQSQRFATTSVVPAPASTFPQYRAGLIDEALRAGANMISNPSFEMDLAAVSVLGGLAAANVARVAVADAVDGSWVMQITSDAASRGARLHGGQLIGSRTGQEYTASIFARSISGSTNWRLLIQVDANGNNQQINLALTPAWQRFSVTLVAASVALAADVGFGYGMPHMSVTCIDAGTNVAQFDAAAMTQGPLLWPWRDTGVGSYQHLFPDGEFEVNAPSATSWHAPWGNRAINPGVEGTLAHWIKINANITLSLIDDTTKVHSGNHAIMGTSGVLIAGTPELFAVECDGTFLAGVTYAATCFYRRDSAGSPLNSLSGQLGVTGVDTSASAGWIGATFTYQLSKVVLWTPAADRTGVRFTIRGAATGSGNENLIVDSVMVHEATTMPFGFRFGFPGGLTGRGATVAQSSDSYSGDKSMQLTTAASPGSAIAYDMTASGPIFWPNRPVTLSFWHKLISGSTDWRVGIGSGPETLESLPAFQAGSTAPGSYVGPRDNDVAVDFTPTAQWQKTELTWIPKQSFTTSAMGGSTVPWTHLAVVWGTPSGTGVGVILLDDIQLAPMGASELPKPFLELDATETGLIGSTTSYAPVSTQLASMNSTILGRQAILPSTAPPYWRYRHRSRASLAAQTPDEPIVEDLQALNGLEIAQDSVINTQAVWYTGGTYGPVTVADDASVVMFGGAPGAVINDIRFVPDLASGRDIATTVLARYKRGVMRPQLTVENRFPSQLWRDIGDLLAVTFERGKLVAVRFYILGLTTTVTEAGQRWETVYTLEESPY